MLQRQQLAYQIFVVEQVSDLILFFVLLQLDFFHGGIRTLLLLHALESSLF